MNKILKNTLALYVRQVVVVLINLYALRVVLNSLGIDDFGVYTVVAGLVTLLAFLPGSMASATQRFFSFAMGRQDSENLKQVFSVNCVLYVAIAIVALLLLQTIGLWFVTEHLSIPDGRKEVAINLYHMVAFGFVLSIFTSPFIAILIAHEDIYLYALMSVVEAALKLSAAILLEYVEGDSLGQYGMFILASSVITTFGYLFICISKYAECQLRKLYWNTVLFKEIIAFTGWTLFGQLSSVFRSQAITILINQLFNPATVAARAIALMVASQAAVFAQHLNTSFYPQVIKSYAADKKEEMFSLILNGSKLTFFLVWVFALPMLIEMDYILMMWLKTPPPEAVIFTQLALVETLVLSLSLPLTTAARAPGKMRLYELSLGSVQLAIFIVSWLVLKAGYPASSVFVVAIIANILMFKIRLLIVRKLIGFPMTPYYKNVLTPVIKVSLLSSVPTLVLHYLLGEGIFSSLLLVFVSVIFSMLCMYYLGLDDNWRSKVKFFVARRVFQRVDSI